MGYDEFLVGNLLWVNLLLAVAAGYVAWWLAKRLPDGWAAGLLGLPIVLVASVVLSALNVLLWLAVWGGSRVLEPLAADLAGGLAFFFESGLEFGLLGIAAALVVYIVSRIRSRRRVTD